MDGKIRYWLGGWKVALGKERYISVLVGSKPDALVV